MFNNGVKFVGGNHSTSYQIENNIFCKRPTFVTEILFMLCTFWDFDFSSVKCYIFACKNSNIYPVKYGVAF